MTTAMVFDDVCMDEWTTENNVKDDRIFKQVEIKMEDTNVSQREGRIGMVRRMTFFEMTEKLEKLKQNKN